MAAQAEANRLQQRGEMETAAQYQLRADQEAEKVVDQTPVGLQIEMAMEEVVPTDRLDIRDTLTAPDAAALDASARRIDLLARMGPTAWRSRWMRHSRLALRTSPENMLCSRRTICEFRRSNGHQAREKGQEPRADATLPRPHSADRLCAQPGCAIDH